MFSTVWPAVCYRVEGLGEEDVPQAEGLSEVVHGHLVECEEGTYFRRHEGSIHGPPIGMYITDEAEVEVDEFETLESSGSISFSICDARLPGGDPCHLIRVLDSEGFSVGRGEVLCLLPLDIREEETDRRIMDLLRRLPSLDSLVALHVCYVTCLLLTVKTDIRSSQQLR